MRENEMILTGVLVNAAAVLAGGSIGSLLRRSVAEKWNKILSDALGLTLLFIGISGSVQGKKPVVILLSFVLSVVLTGVLFENRFAVLIREKIGRRFADRGKKSAISTGFVNGVLFVCPGAMAIAGALESGITGRCDILFAKAALDVVATLIIASVSGIGTALAAFPLFLYEGSLTLAARAVSPLLTDAMTSEIAAAGSLLIVALGLNVLKITKIPLGRFIPAPFLVIPLYCLF